MSRKTKAEIEMENTALKAQYTALEGRYKALGLMYKALEKRCGQLEDQNQNLQGYIDLLNEMVDTDQRDLKITNKACDDAINKHIEYRNEVAPLLYKHSKGIHTIAKNRTEKSNYYKEQFTAFREQGLNPDNARHMANEETKKKFGKGYSERNWYNLTKELQNG